MQSVEKKQGFQGTQQVYCLPGIPTGFYHTNSCALPFAMDLTFIDSLSHWGAHLAGRLLRISTHG